MIPKDDLEFGQARLLVEDNSVCDRNKGHPLTEERQLALLAILAPSYESAS